MNHRILVAGLVTFMLAATSCQQSTGTPQMPASPTSPAMSRATPVAPSAASAASAAPGNPAAVSSAAPTDTLVNPKDGMVLVRIPGGTYTIGSDAGDSNEKPVHSVTLEPYAIGKTEVTNAQFRAFVKTTGHKAAGDWESCARMWGEQAPVVYVSWTDARTYCAWAGLRLPTEAEWEVAARGGDGLTYPWGDTWDASKCSNSAGHVAESASPVGSYPQGASPFGCLDMAGNVWEWCSSKYAPYPYVASDGREELGEGQRVLRGGSWGGNHPGMFRGACRYWGSTGCGQGRGFRSARTL